MNFKIIIKSFLQKQLFWVIIKQFSLLIDWLSFYKKEFINDLQRKADIKFIEKFGSNLVVHEGIFTGLKYPSMRSFGSMLYPKLVGCYEEELHSIFDSLFEINFTQIIDIGCAEGYYAVGMASKFPNAQIIAFDIDNNALQMAKHMAVVNNVANQIQFEAKIDSERLINIDSKRKTLIICDCEGFEIELFTEKAISALQNAYIIIETHDFIKSNISSELKTKLVDTHRVQIIPTKSKTNYKKYTFFQSLNAFEREYYSDEHRPSKMTWLYCAPKTVMI